MGRKRKLEREVDENEIENQLKKDFEAERKELGLWVGWNEYREARQSEGRIRAFGIVGAYMAGKKREEIRKLYRISPNKLNNILNSSTVDDVLEYSLNHIFSFQNAAIQAILFKLTEEHDGHLAMTLLDKMGLFKRMEKLTQPIDEVSKGEQKENDVVGILLSKGKNLQARQVSDAISKFVVEAFKSNSPD